jgi:D-3-phosphoglycerate dehydrogenase
VIGQIGTALGTEKINIASMIVARQSVGGNALMVINIDDLATEAQLKNLSSLKGMRGKIKQISF